MTSHRQKLEYVETSLKVPSEVWQTAENGYDDDAMVQNKDSQNNSYSLDDSWAYDPDFETWEEVDLEDVALDNSFASHRTDDLGENHSYSGRSLPHNEAHSPSSMISKSTVESKISFLSGHHSVSQQDPQALRYELSSNSSTLMQSSRGDSWVTVTPLSCSSTPMKANSNSNRYPRTDVKHSEISPKRRESHFTCERYSDPGSGVQNLNFESQSEKNLHGFHFNQRYVNGQKSSSSQKQKHESSQEKQKSAVYDWGPCYDQEFSKEDHSDSDKDSFDQWVKAKLHVPTETSGGAKTEPRSKFCRTFDSSNVSCDDSKVLFKKCENNNHPVNDSADQMDPSSQVSSDLSSVTGLDTGDGASKTTENYCIQR